MLYRYFRELYDSTAAGWNRFWFQASDPATLCLIRILAGLMLLYSHAVWSLDLLRFFGPEGRISREFVTGFHGSPYGWSHLNWLSTPSAIWCFHIGALIVFALLTLGLASRWMSVLAFLLTVSYSHRAVGALFGLDQANVLLSMYLMVGPCGACYSLDRWWADRRGQRSTTSDQPLVGANVAVRLIQIHMCVIYLFAGLGKLQGTSWWDGTALWLAVANYEYQTIDVTWLGRWPWVINLLTHATVLWEISYSVLVWPRLTRPIVLALAVPVHLGIAFCMGMITFGLAMLIGNLAFVPPGVVRQILGRWGRAGQGAAASVQ